MNGLYKDKIKVVCDDKMCFPVDPKTLKPITSSIYDPYAWSDPDPEPLETITISELYRRQDARAVEERVKNSSFQLIPMAIFTRSADGKRVRLSDVSLPRWQHEHLRRYERLNCSIYPSPAAEFSVADTSPSPHDTAEVCCVQLERYYRCEFGRVVLDGAVIADPDQAARFIRHHECVAGANR